MPKEPRTTPSPAVKTEEKVLALYVALGTIAAGAHVVQVMVPAPLLAGHTAQERIRQMADAVRRGAKRYQTAMGFDKAGDTLGYYERIKSGLVRDCDTERTALLDAWGNPSDDVEAVLDLAGEIMQRVIETVDLQFKPLPEHVPLVQTSAAS